MRTLIVSDLGMSSDLQSLSPFRSVHANITGAIGTTPLVALQKISAGTGGLVLLKLEYFNPGHSKKDRIALEMIRAAKASGQLRDAQPVVELTSGNTGTGLAIVCAAHGHPFIAVMSEGNSVERARMMRALGAEVVLVPQCEGSRHGQVSGADLERVNARVEQIVRERGAFRADQFQLESNPDAHVHGTGRELLEQTGGRLDAFVEFVGSGGTFTGVSRALKKALPNVKCFVVEPRGAAILAGAPVTNPNHRIQGGGYSRTLPLFDAALCDGYIQVDDEEAMATARRLAKEEGIFAGFSTGANVAAALRVLQQHRNAVVACLAADSGLKYLSTDLYP
jgi:cysteine synthase A